MSEAFHGQSTKEMYRCDIEDSIKQKTVYKLYEYLDDHSYCDSENIGVWIRPHTIKCRDVRNVIVRNVLVRSFPVRNVLVRNVPVNKDSSCSYSFPRCLSFNLSVSYLSSI